MVTCSHLRALLLALLATVVVSKRAIGILRTQEDWHYLERFCFVSEVGNLLYELQYPEEYMVEKLYLYYDSSTQWPAVYDSGQSCSDKEAHLHISNNQILNLSFQNTDQHGEPICRAIVRNGNESWLKCAGNRRFISQRERWWFLALGNCNSSRGLYVEYDFSFTNGQVGQVWFYEFSADEFYILPTDLGFLLLEILALVAGTTIALMLRARQLFHQTYKLFLISLMFETFSLFCMCAAYGRYAQDGIGLPLMKLFGQLFRAAGTVAFLYLLILLAKGYTISRGRLSKNANWKLLVLMSSFILTYCALFVWQIRVFDPAKVTYLFESYPGYGLVGLRIFAWLWFCHSAYMTLARYPEKRGFYLAFSAAYSLWFWMGPISIIIANHVLDDWVREKVVNGVENTVAFYGFFLFLVLTRPSAANSNFPFHVRTTQIGAMNVDDVAAFPHNAYEVRYSTRHDAAFTVPSAPSLPKPFDPRASPTSIEPLNRQGDAPPTYQEAVLHLSDGAQANE